AMLSIPSVKGISFGDGETLAAMKGSEANDQMTKDGYLSNHQGGINGGVSNGNELFFRLILRPVSSVSLPQRTIDKSGNDRVISIKGRHDSCHIPRVIPVAEAMLKLCLADAIQHQRLIRGEASSLESFRESLDALDEELLLLLYRRRQIVQQVKDYKLLHCLPNRDAAREEAILKRVEAIACELELNPKLAREIMRLGLKICQ
ncbi:MAG: chorismate synthase, partial [Candidatus Cloacimonetes bacterium]|nr:chorismate synthase [Candidatus Cloacimonadota bacterium]